jgi:hypothetical protein
VQVQVVGLAVGERPEQLLLVLGVEPLPALPQWQQQQEQETRLLYPLQPAAASAAAPTWQLCFAAAP